MKTGGKVAIAIISALGLTAIIVAIASAAKAKVPSTAGTNNAKEVLANGQAIADQFDEIYAISKNVGSDLFTNMNADQLEKANSTFTSNLTYKDASSLISLLNKPSGSWSASDRILFDTLTKKWKGPDSAKVTVPNKPVSASTPKPSYQYDILTDADYDSKIAVLDTWRNALLEKQKKGLAGLFQKNLPDKNDFNKKFLPVTLSDIKQYSSLQMKDEKDRNVKEETIMATIRKKYPSVFRGVTKIYSLTGEIANNRLRTQ